VHSDVIASNTVVRESKLQPAVFAMLGVLVSGAVRLNHGNGQLRDSDHPVFAYRTSIQGLRFDVQQNYDQGGKAVDAIAVSVLTELPRACIASFNHILALLQETYEQPGSPPLKSRVGDQDVKYTVLFQFARNAGIEAEVTSVDPGRGGATAGNRPGNNRGVNGVGRCLIRLHYLPPGWVGTL